MTGRHRAADRARSDNEVYDSQASRRANQHHVPRHAAPESDNRILYFLLEAMNDAGQNTSCGDHTVDGNHSTETT